MSKDKHDAMAADKVMDHLWRYFALHAQQRVSVFNFFVVLSGVISAAIGGALQVGGPLNFVVVILGLLLPLLSFVFWRLDQRNAELIKISERALRCGEEAYLPEYARIFVQESPGGTGDAEVKDRVARTKWTFRTSFRLIFVVMGVTGILASSFAVYRWISYLQAQVEKGQKASISTGGDAALASPDGSGSSSSSQNTGQTRSQMPHGEKNTASGPRLVPGKADAPRE